MGHVSFPRRSLPSPQKVDATEKAHANITATEMKDVLREEVLLEEIAALEYEPVDGHGGGALAGRL